MAVTGARAALSATITPMPHHSASIRRRSTVVARRPPAELELEDHALPEGAGEAEPGGGPLRVILRVGVPRVVVQVHDAVNGAAPQHEQLEKAEQPPVERGW